MAEWPAKLPKDAKNSVIRAAVQVLLSRELSFWLTMGGSPPIAMLISGTEDDDFGSLTAGVLCRLIDAGVLDKLHPAMDEDLRARVRGVAAGSEFPPGLDKLINEVDNWASNRPVSKPELDRWNVLQAAQSKMFSIQQERAATGAAKAAAADRRWDQFIRGDAASIAPKDDST